jgi:quinol monooxygenase YgiN
MVIEYIRYVIPAARHAEFLAAYASAAYELRAAPQCHRHEISQGIEEHDNYIVRIEWESMEGHLSGFRGGPRFPGFFDKVKPFFADIREMKHYDVKHAG